MFSGFTAIPLNSPLTILNSVLGMTATFYKLFIENVPEKIADRLLSSMKDQSESELKAETKKVKQRIDLAKKCWRPTVNIDLNWLSEDEFEKAVALMKEHKLSGNYTKVVCIETKRLDFTKRTETTHKFEKYKE